MLLVVLVSSCSKIEIVEDPIIGIWENPEITSTTAKNIVVDNEEWIFNDVYLGRFHGYKDGKVVFLTDFKWNVNNGIYNLSYPGTDLPDDFVEIKETELGAVLLRTEGKIFAQKQN